MAEAGLTNLLALVCTAYWDTGGLCVGSSAASSHLHYLSLCKPAERLMYCLALVALIHRHAVRNLYSESQLEKNAWYSRWFFSYFFYLWAESGELFSLCFPSLCKIKLVSYCCLCHVYYTFMRLISVFFFFCVTLSNRKKNKGNISFIFQITLWEMYAAH